MKVHSKQRSIHERGYILLTLMLFVALLAIGAMAWVEKIDFQIKRDREEELIHRGVQYSRAVRWYFKKFGRYPTRIEELESTNNLRFLRKRYKDPISGKDFKPLHMTDVQVSFNPGAASGLPPGPDANISAQQPQSPGAPGALDASATAPGGPGPSAIPQTGSQEDTSQSGNAPPANGAAGQNLTPQPLSGQATPGGPQTFGGGAIIGVASMSKLKTIREFNKKDRYNQWQFIYDPSTDRGGLLMTPNQPPLQGAVQQNQNQQQNGQPGPQNQGFSQNPGFGQNPALGQNPGTGMNPVQPNPQPPDQNQQ